MMAVSSAVSPPGTVCKKDDSHLDLARLDDDEKEVNASKHSLPRMYNSDVYSQLIGEQLEAAIRDRTPLAFTDFMAKVVRALDNLEADSNRSEMQAVNEQKIVAALHTLSNCLDKLDQKLLVPIVGEFLKFRKWSDISPIITEAYVQFLSVVLSSAPKWWPEIATKVLQQFVRPSIKLNAQHIVLRRLLAIVPTSSAGLSEIFQANFPHPSSPSSELVNYADNLLRALEYAPEQTASVWHLVVQKLVTLDVECESAEEAIKRRLNTLDSDSELDSDSDGNDSGSEMDSDSDIDSDIDSGMDTTDSEGDIDSDIDSDASDTDLDLDPSKPVPDLVNKRTRADEVESGLTDEDALSAKRQKIDNFDEGDELTNGELAMAAASQMEPNSTKVDAVLNKLLSYLSTKFTSQMVKSGQSTPLFKTLLSVFREVVLPTANLQATQFLWFYITHAHADLLASFISSLLESALSVSTSYEQRVRAMQYVASFAARAKGLTKQQIVFVVEFLASWVQRYIREREQEVDSSLSMARFRMFYAAVQALFYIFVFRHSMLRNNGTRGWVANVDKLFPQVINSKFNPLQYCQPQVVAMFAAVAQHEEVASCYSIIERNRWGSFRANSQLGSAHRTGAHNGLFDNNRDSKLYDSFFPFQPLRLKQSKQYFTTIFEKWSEVDLSDSDTDREMELDREIDASESDY